MVDLSIDNERYIVVVYGEQCRYSYILGRHSLWQSLPSVECVTQLLGWCGQLNLCPELNRCSVVCLAVYNECYTVAVYLEQCRYSYILGRHSLWQSLPSVEGITLLLGLCGQLNLCPELNCCSVVDLSIDNERYIVVVYGEQCRYSYILGRHSLWQSLPSVECVTLLLGCCNGHYFCTLLKVYGLVYFAINHIGQFVPVSVETHRELGIIQLLLNVGSVCCKDVAYGNIVCVVKLGSI